MVVPEMKLIWSSRFLHRIMNDSNRHPSTSVIESSVSFDLDDGEIWPMGVLEVSSAPEVD
jgi:hypothetical protein